MILLALSQIAALEGANEESLCQMVAHWKEEKADLESKLADSAKFLAAADASWWACQTAEIGREEAHRLADIDLDAMLGGLLQDIGSLPLLSELEHWPELPRDSASLNALCEQLSGDIGALILTRWQLPSAVIECARLHGQWQREHERSADLADLVLLASALQSGSTPDGLLPAQVKLGLERPLDELRAELAEGLKLWKRLLA